ncbi:protein kinase domain-containing protein [Actinoplanes sp. CA-054009]
MSDFERAHPRQALADFELGAKLGESAAAEVFRARNRTFDIVVALKRWRRPFAPSVQRAFAETCRLHYELSEHPNVVRLLWADLAGDPPWLATELQQGSLAELLRRGPIPPARAGRIAVDVLRGLTAIHHRGRSHGALKPSNVLVSSEGRAMLRDLAPATSSVPDMRAATTLVGALFPDPPPAVRALLARPPRTAEAFLVAVESARGEGREPYVENAGPFRTSGTGPAAGEGGAGVPNTGAYDAPRPAEPSDLPANLHTPAPASRRENARSYPEKSAQSGGSSMLDGGPAGGGGPGPGGAPLRGNAPAPLCGGVPTQGGPAVPGGPSAHGSVPGPGGASGEGGASGRSTPAPRGDSRRGSASGGDGAAGSGTGRAFGGAAGPGEAAGRGRAAGSGAGSGAGMSLAGGDSVAVELYRRPGVGRRWVRVLVVAAGVLVLAAVVAVVVAYGQRKERPPGPAPSVEPASGLVRF